MTGVQPCALPIYRRVEITASGSVLKLQEGGQVNGGTQGPAPLYQK